MCLYGQCRNQEWHSEVRIPWRAQLFARVSTKTRTVRARIELVASRTRCAQALGVCVCVCVWKVCTPATSHSWMRTLASATENRCAAVAFQMHLLGGVDDHHLSQTHLIPSFLNLISFLASLWFSRGQQDRIGPNIFAWPRRRSGCDGHKSIVNCDVFGGVELSEKRR